MFAVLFIGLVVVFVPARVPSWSGIRQPNVIGVPQIVGVMIGVNHAVGLDELVHSCARAIELALDLPRECEHEAPNFSSPFLSYSLPPS